MSRRVTSAHHTPSNPVMSQNQENSFRPRRAGANYGPMPPPRDPLVNIPLSLKRKDWIMDFKNTNKKFVFSEKWLQKLHQFLNEKDDQILVEDVRRWVQNHAWITVAGGQPPETLKMRNQEDTAPSTTPKKKASSASTTPKNEKKVTFKTPELEIRYISPRPPKTPAKPGPKVRFPKPPPGFFSTNNN